MAELIQQTYTSPEIILAMTDKLGLKKVAGTIHPYPPHTEASRRTGNAYNHTCLTPFVQGFIVRWLAWPR